MASFSWPAKGGGGGGGPYALNGRAGTEPISNGSSSVSVTFSAVFSSLNYSVVFSVTNEVDGFPIFLNGIITAKSVSGFTVTFNAPTDSINYVLEYIASENT